MSQSDSNLEVGRGLVAVRFVIAAMLLLCVGLFTAARAQAAFEETGTFAGSAKPVLEEQFSEEVQLGGVSGMAVNTTGAGGVPAGTIYAATESQATIGGGLRIAVFKPNGTGGLTFSEAWFVNPFAGDPYERCGPEGEPTDPHCSIRASGPVRPYDVEVDQTTGDVYVDADEFNAPGLEHVVVFSADGSKEVTRFGESAETFPVAEHPDETHSSPGHPDGLAVDGAGNVYLEDSSAVVGNYHRLMVFSPQGPGDYEHYVYAGEVYAGSGGNEVEMPALDAAGHVYGVSGGTNVEEYAAEAPSGYPGPPASPICRFKFVKGGITSMTVDPASGEVFFYSPKLPNGVHRLGPCDEATGEFTEVSPEPELFKVVPERSEATALVFDPVRQLESSRQPGVLYGGAGSGVPKAGLGEPGQSSLGYIFGHPQELAPVVVSESAARVGVTAVSLHATINPNGLQTHYVFQYLRTVEYEANPSGERFAGARETPVGGGSLQGGLGVQNVAVSVAGLAPDTEYRYRVIASSECGPGKPCEGTGEAEGFSTFPSEPAGLPDHRVYELVSPPVKDGGEVYLAEPEISSCGADTECKPGGEGVVFFPMQSSVDGDAVVFEGSPFSESEGATRENEYFARRDEHAGWQTTNVTPRLLTIFEGKYKAFDGGLGQGVLYQPGVPSPTLSSDAPSGYPDLYFQGSPDPGSLTPLVSSAPPDREPASFKLEYAGHSADFSRQFFSANDALSEATPFAPAAVDGGVNENNLYEWDGGVLSLVNVLPGNTETKPGATFGSVNPDSHAISSDGRRVFWSSSTGQVYVREDGERTREVPDHTGRFLTASADGSRVLLSDGTVYDLDSETTVDLTGGQGGFQGILGQSEDLSNVYFVDTAALTSPSEENANHEHALTGEDNLYSWHEGSVVFVATLLASDNVGGAGQTEGIEIIGDWASSPASRTAEASPQGRFLAFQSRARLTGYDNTGPCRVPSGPKEVAEAGGEGNYLPGGCTEVFLYDSATARLICASCNPSGERPLGWSTLRQIKKGLNAVLPQPRYVTDEGRLFFDSEDALSPRDTNEGVEDVYEYEPEGAGRLGTCQREAGCVFLISAGTGSVDSNFLAMDENGANVFFTTRDQLSKRDHDDLFDLYDAREGGGLAVETEAPAGECGCHNPPVSPGGVSPGSVLFSGPGDLVSPLPSIVVVAKKKTVTQTNSAKLAKALRACRKSSKTKRKRCEATARKRYAKTVRIKTRPKSKQSSSEKGGK
jgi:hypothetical protein